VADVVDSLPTIDEVYLYDLIEGEPGTTTGWQHSSGRPSVELPAGWRVGEFDEGIGFLAAPSPVRYNEEWEADGVAVTLYSDLSSDEFFALLDETTIAQSCLRIEDHEAAPTIDDGLEGRAAGFRCGSDGAVGSVIARYDGESGAGILIEAQRDDLPDAESDIEMLDAIIDSLAWD
jgi:hypothetical protein